MKLTLDIQANQLAKLLKKRSEQIAKAGLTAEEISSVGKKLREVQHLITPK